MRPTSGIPLALGLVLCLSGFALAQGQEPATGPDPQRIFLPGARSPDFKDPAGLANANDSRDYDAGLFKDSVGLHYLDGELWGGGHRFKVRFGANGIEYTPALPPAPHNFPLTLRVTGYGRGTANEAPSGPRVGMKGLTALYQRAEFVESYEVRPEGIKQSFTFQQLPAGTGDLVVQLRIDTDLKLAPTSDGGPGLRFLYEDIGGVSIGEVIGIDATGAKVQGSLQYEQGVLEMRLPASFVDRAALPLVLDPLVGSIFNVATGTNDDSDPDVAYDATNNRYLVVFNRAFSSTDRDVHGQMVNADGTLNGGRLLIENSTAYEVTGRVANVNAENAFVVTYARDSAFPSSSDDIVGRAVRASDRVIGTRVTIEGGTDSLSSPDVGGEATTLDDEAIVVWDNNTADEIQARQVNVNGSVSPPTLTPFGGAAVLIGDSGGTSWSNSSPAISKSGGTTGNHLIVWNRQFSSTSNTAVRGAIVSRNLSILDSLLAIASTSTGDNDFPDVDGDGNNWVVAYETEASPGSGDNDIAARSVGYDPNGSLGNRGFFHSGEVMIEAGVGDNEFGAHVAWVGESAIVTYTDNFSGADDDVVVQPIDVFTCLDCGPRQTVNSSLDDDDTIRAASERSGGGNGAGALLVHRQRDINPSPGTNDNDILARRFRADDGIVTDLGGGCGSSRGTPYANCAVTGFSAFESRLRGAGPSTSAWLVIGTDRIDFACGSCTLVPDPFSGFVIALTTDSRGDASLATAIPSSSALVGASFIEQWLVMDTVSPLCSTFGTDISNAIQVTIQ